MKDLTLTPAEDLSLHQQSWGQAAPAEKAGQALSEGEGAVHFKIRFNTMHGDTDMYWRVIIGDEEHLVRSVRCKLETYSDASFDKNAGVIKYHIAGRCKEFIVDENRDAVFQ